MLQIVFIFIALVIGLIIGGFMRSTKKRDREYERALNQYLIDNEKKCS
jgi:hypothetical protein